MKKQNVNTTSGLKNFEKPALKEEKDFRAGHETWMCGEVGVTT